MDTDGSFLGAVGAVVPQAEYEWDGDPRRGLGDYRIPKVMLTFPNGSRIPVNQIAPYKGNGSKNRSMPTTKIRFWTEQNYDNKLPLTLNFINIKYCVASFFPQVWSGKTARTWIPGRATSVSSWTTGCWWLRVLTLTQKPDVCPLSLCSETALWIWSTVGRVLSDISEIKLKKNGERVSLIKPCICVFRSSGSRLVFGLHLPEESVSLPQRRRHRSLLRRLLQQRQPSEASPHDAEH